MKDAEIQQLQATLQSREISDQTQVIDNLRTELTALVENNRQGTILLTTIVTSGHFDI